MHRDIFRQIFFSLCGELYERDDFAPHVGVDSKGARACFREADESAHLDVLSEALDREGAVLVDRDRGVLMALL